MNLSRIEVVYKPLSEIHRYSGNPRNNENAVGPVAASIQAFGFLVPIVIDADGEIIAGDTRYQAAQMLGLEEVPTVSAEDLTPEEVRAFRLADNKTAELAVWDLPLLDAEMLDLSEAMELEGIADSLDMSDFGFDLGDSDVTEGPDSSRELDLDDFGDDEFDYECPHCGFKFNEYE